MTTPRYRREVADDGTDTDKLLVAILETLQRMLRHMVLYHPVQVPSQASQAELAHEAPKKDC